VSLPTTLKPESLRALFLRGVRLLGGRTRPDIDARVLLLNAAGISEETFHAHPDLRPSSEASEKFLGMVARRSAGVPLAYLTGRKEFWSLEFRVGPGVLIPRPETEILVETAVGFAAGRKASVLDVGTGSGNIAVALARELPGARVTASDISVRALRTAAANAVSNGCPGLRFVRSDLFSAFGRPGPRFDIIVSNPPYVGREEWAGLPAEVRDHEPRRALVGGVRGTELTARLVREARRFLKPCGRLVLEIGAGQDETVRAMFGAGWDAVEVVPDLAGIPRVVAARKAATAKRGLISRTPACGNR
jgi:release factor glutamine methyltransferase